MTREEIHASSRRRKAEMLALRESGLTIKKVAKAFGISETGVRETLWRAGIDRRGNIASDLRDIAKAFANPNCPIPDHTDTLPETFQGHTANPSDPICGQL